MPSVNLEMTISMLYLDNCLLFRIVINPIYNLNVSLSTFASLLVSEKKS